MSKEIWRRVLALLRFRGNPQTSWPPNLAPVPISQTVPGYLDSRNTHTDSELHVTAVVGIHPAILEHTPTGDDSMNANNFHNNTGATRKPTFTPGPCAVFKPRKVK